MAEITILKRYEKLYQIITELSAETEITEILEIGCFDGRFVEFLREQKKNAFGFEFNPHSLNVSKEYFASDGDIASLGTYFGGMLFDLICANGVMSKGAVLGTLLATPLATPLGESTIVDLLNIAREASPKNNQEILKSTFHRLKPGKYFVATESAVDENDVLAFTEHDAIAIGYDVIRYSPGVAVLQKGKR